MLFENPENKNFHWEIFTLQNNWLLQGIAVGKNAMIDISHAERGYLPHQGQNVRWDGYC